MGRITIFTADGCPHSIRTKRALQKQSLPFTEINVTTHPSRLKDMMALSDRLSTPQVFFNTRYIGGADETVELIQEWVKDKRRYKTPLDRYLVEIGAQPDPFNPRFNIPDVDSEVLKVEDIVNVMERSTQQDTIAHPSGVSMSYSQLMEELKRILPRSDNTHHMQTYSMCFTAQQAAKAMAVEYDLSYEESMHWGKHWQQMGVIDHVAGKQEFGDDGGTYFFRLQCDQHPEVLNTYTKWPRPAKRDPMDIIKRLHTLLQHLMNRMIDRKGMFDYEEAARKKEYQLLQYFVCEIQRIDVSKMDDTTKTAFGINVCNLMLRFAYIQHGFGETES
jgi:glutaredoxin 3